MQEKEIKDLAISAVVLALAFAINMTFRGQGDIITLFMISLATLSLSFILHEIGHRYMARKFNCYAEYRMWRNGLLIALVFSPIAIFAAPGAVMIYPRADLWGRTAPLSRQGSGLISLAGPAMNLMLAISFLLLGLTYPAGIFGEIFYLGSFINIWLALFNLIPFPPLDGSKILAWDIRIWIALFAITAALFLALY